MFAQIITCDLFDLFKAAKIMEFMTKIKTLVVVAAPAVGENLNFLVCLAGDRGLGNFYLRTWCPNCFVSCACVKSAKTNWLREPCKRCLIARFCSPLRFSLVMLLAMPAHSKVSMLS